LLLTHVSTHFFSQSENQNTNPRRFFAAADGLILALFVCLRAMLFRKEILPRLILPLSGWENQPPKIPEISCTMTPSSVILTNQKLLRSPAANRTGFPY